MTQSIQTFDSARHIVDGFDLGSSERTGSFVLAEEKLTIIETGPSISVPHIISGLKKLGLTPEAVRNIIVTHIHLDHAGGCGLLLKHCPGASVYVHEKGARHLADPSRLVQGARHVYQDSFDDLFSPVVPVPEEAINRVQDGDHLRIGPNCNLTFYDTPGHANHHIGIYDEKTGTFYSGDTLGVRYPALARSGLDLILPSTSPNQFDPEKMINSASKVRKLKPGKIAFGHYGICNDTDSVFSQLSHWLDVFIHYGKKHYQAGDSYGDLRNSLLAEIKQYAEKYTELTDKDCRMLELDLSVSSMGLLDYLRKADR
ncbi:MBL fold metallo-hydrolase [Alteribacter natronophilus]|uniref:MBL fold metallo-hydrolase n=1 Tax=Alteribacter natronophilus TaxID=2583810 RepID=UPI00110F04CC|nr:MBL fold metallo-hydrolase [Alteribacter natronophilus]TMW73537.1 MBL fold metallo-hydrolase [Alteribacter natronophilus]